MKIETIIVLYNPKKEFLDHYLSLFSFSEKVYFIDNSTKINSELVQNIQKLDKAVYLSMGGNKGIAEALHLGMDMISKDGADFALTLDQDSIFPSNRIAEIKAILNANPEYGIIGLNFNSKETSLEIVDCKWWLTSGNFVNVNDYHQLSFGFNQQLFIDGVDNDICYQFHQAGYKVGYIKGISLEHTIGNPKVYSIGKLRFSVLNYAPIRYYYIFRNIYYLYSLNADFFREDKHNIDKKMFWKIVLFEKNKHKKLKAIRYGKRDAKNKVLGPCKHEDII